MKAVNRNSVARVSRLLTVRVSDGAHRSIKMFPVRSENQTQKITLVPIFRETLVGKVRKLIGAQVQNSNRLMRHILLDTITIIQQGGVASIGTERDGGRKAVRSRNSANRRCPQPFAGRKMDDVAVRSLP